MEDITTRLDGITFTDRFEGHSPKIVLWQDGSIDAKARPATLFISKDDKPPKVVALEEVLPYIHHNEGCDRLSRYSSKWGKVTEWEMRKCTCGLSEFLQRINDRSK